MLAAFRPPRGPGERCRGYVAPPRMLPAGAFPRQMNRRASGNFALFRKAGRRRLPCPCDRAGRTPRAFQRRVPFALSPRGTFIVPLSHPDSCSCVLPVSGLWGACAQRMFRAALVLRSPASHAAPNAPPSFRSRSVPSGKAIGCVFPPFRRRASHAGRERRLSMSVG